MTYSEIVSRFQIPLNKGPKSASSRLSNRHIISLVRAKKPIAKRQLKQELAELNTLLSLNCFELKKASAIDCECLGLESCESVMKSVNKLPTIEGLIQVTSIDGNTMLSRVEATSKAYALNHSRIGKENPKFYILNDYLYTVNYPKKYVRVVADFEEDDVVGMLNTQCKSDATASNCFNALDTEMSGETIVIDRAISLAIAEFIKTWQSGSEDNLNNAKSNDLSREQEDIKTQNS